MVIRNDVNSPTTVGCLIFLQSKFEMIFSLHRKFEEIYPPDVGEFVYITDDTYKVKQVLRMEHLVLKVLSFDLVLPTINSFLSLFESYKCIQQNRTPY